MQIVCRRDEIAVKRAHHHFGIMFIELRQFQCASPHHRASSGSPISVIVAVAVALMHHVATTIAVVAIVVAVVIMAVIGWLMWIVVLHIAGIVVL